MKKTIVKKGVILLTVIAFLSVLTVSFAEEKNTGSGKFNQGTKGHAKEGLEDTAGKKLNDVKVPDVPAPTPVKNYEVNNSTSSYDVNNSTTTSTGTSANKKK